MSDAAITVTDLSKKYRLGEDTGYKTLRETISFLTAASSRKAAQQDLWALKDICFQLERGDVLGLIGRNGAGKSTLLKILCGITPPTSGRAEIRGRVGSLLEVGTGFHQELTGRENVYLNGAILGMSRLEVRTRFDEIVEFSGVSAFLDTPVKRYSSGMRMRLAFSVAAHLEPDILLIDEVLAVGDAEFQRRCLGKMDEVAGGGRTIIFVSHNLGAVSQLCTRVALFETGRLLEIGPPSKVVQSYLNTGEGDVHLPVVNRPGAGSKPMGLCQVAVRTIEGRPSAELDYAQPFDVTVDVEILAPLPTAYLALHIHDDKLETLLFSRYFDGEDGALERLPLGVHRLHVRVPAPLLRPGRYCVSVHLATTSPSALVDGIDHLCLFDLIDSGSDFARRGLPWRGALAVPLRWSAVALVHPQEDAH